MKANRVPLNERSYVSQYEIGDWTFGIPTVADYGANSGLKIGKYCSISEDVTIVLGGEHDWRNLSTFSFDKILEGVKDEGKSRRKTPRTIIGSDVWIGRRALILSGVHIGDGAVVGAGTVVSRDVGAYEIVGGAPMQSLGYRFDQKTRGRLQALQWWNWPDDVVEKAIPVLLTGNIDALERLKP